VALLELPDAFGVLAVLGVVPVAFDVDRCPELPAVAEALCELCEDVEDSVFVPASLVSLPFPEPLLSSPHAPAATSKIAAKPKRKVDLFIVIPVARRATHAGAM